MDRYSIIYTWKVLAGIVPDCGLVKAPVSPRRGCLLMIPPLGKLPGCSRKLKEDGFITRASRLWNSLPQSLRDDRSSDLGEFKFKLDQFLELVPDQPKVSGLVPDASNQDGSPSNSILVWVQLLDLKKWTQTTAPLPRRGSRLERRGREGQ